MYRERHDWGLVASPPVNNKSDQDLVVAKQLNPVPTPSCLRQEEISEECILKVGEGEQETSKMAPVLSSHVTMRSLGQKLLERLLHLLWPPLAL